MKSVWTLAGHDPFGGAGIHADIRVAAGWNRPIRSIITSYTAQNDKEFLKTEIPSVSWLETQWKALSNQESPSAVKIGLISNVETIQFLAAQSIACPIILDPVLKSSSGKDLTSDEELAALKKYLWPRISLLTPNRFEAERLTGISIRTLSDVKRVADIIRGQGVKAVLIKGGHGEGDDLVDYFDDGAKPFFLTAKRVPGEYRGTGCTLSTAIACALTDDYDLRESVILAHSYVQAAIREASRRETNHLPSVSGTPELSPIFFTEPFEVHFPRMSRSIGFYVVAPDAKWVDRLGKAQVPTLQLRAKDIDPKDWDQEIRASMKACEDSGSLFFLNDNWQAALEYKTFGLHLGQEDLDGLSPANLQRIADAGIRLGISTHSIEEAARAKAFHPSYIALGPVFETTCKSMRFGPQGISKVGEWVKRLPNTPVVAIGGLKQEHARSLLALGADGIAVISDVTQAKDPESRVNEWRNTWA